MPIPKFHEIMLPLLELYSDNQTHYRKDFLDQICSHFELTKEEVELTIPTGYTKIWERTHWAQYYLKAAEMLESPKKGYFRITQRGLQTLELKLTALTPAKIKELYPNLLEKYFWNPSLKKKDVAVDSDQVTELESTPDESLDTILNQKQSIVRSEILESINRLTPRQFETLVVKVLEAMGYGTGIVTNYTNDGGIDGIIQADELGFDKIYIQAKKYEGNVGRPDIQKFVGAMVGTSKGVFITTSNFASSVGEYLKSRQENIILINGEKLVELMYKHNQGVTVIQNIEIKRIDTDYFEEL